MPSCSIKQCGARKSKNQLQLTLHRKFYHTKRACKKYGSKQNRKKSIDIKMAENVDTEASDVLENENYEEELENESYEKDHTDFSVVVIKQEVLNYYDSEFESTTSSVQDRRPNSELTYSADFQNYHLNCNKIILGSKPNTVTHESDDEVDIENLDEVYLENDEYFTDDTKLNVNCIDNDDFEEFVFVYKPKVELPDAHSYLHKSKKFCDTCGILFPDLNTFKNHLLMFHAGKVHKKNDLSDRRIYKCTICYKKFVTRQVLRNHLGNIHSLNIAIISQIVTKRKYQYRYNNEMRQYRCTICAKSFVAAQVLRRHLVNIHKFNSTKVSQQQEYKSNMKNNTKVSDSQNMNYEKSLVYTCFHCKITFDTQKSLQEHLDDILQMKRKNREIIPVLKSILFKCNKCDIHFTSSQFAAGHAQHMEMLINWKCTICNRIFKKEDASSHEIQHSVSNNFLVYNLENLDITKILYKCSKCCLHFTENNFLYHFRDCGLEMTKSVKCDICDISLDYNLKALHESDKHTEPNHYTIIKSDVISENPAKSTANQIQEEGKLEAQLNFPFREVKVVLQKIDSHNFKSLEKNEQDYENKHLRRMNYYHCGTCKCFITDFRKKVHLRARCKNFPKVSCKHCGLMFTKASIMTHMRLHEEMKDLTWYNFHFFNLRSGKPVNPPIPEYPKCVHCAVHFLSVTAKNCHVCCEVASLTCHICEIELSEAAFKLHMTFHQYPTDGTKMIEANDLKHAENLDPSINKKFNDENVPNSTNSTSKETDIVSSLDVTEAPLQMYELIYSCRNCSVSVDTYDKAVEHCQRHYENEELVTRTIVCNDCNFNLDEACYTEHQNHHERGCKFKSLHFDSYYLPAENNKWINHIFKTLPKENVSDILRKSIYRYECRIKMDVIQQGDPTLTVYRCDQCSCFIDPSSLSKHSDNACFKLRNHPCTVCGIPFNSSASRIDHEKIHNRPGVTADSYRIVVFNRKQDLQVNRSFCLRKNYVLYKCRNCGVLIDKLLGDFHECDFTNVKECPDCSLLLSIKDYESHMSTHKEFISFNYKNMKVILLGEVSPIQSLGKKNLKSNFKGAIYDYKIFVCDKCQLCIRNEKDMSKHTCRYGKQRLKCLKCSLYFSVGRLKTHTRCHEQDPDFVRTNMHIIKFDPSSLDRNKNSTSIHSKDKDKNCELSDSNTDSDSEILCANDDADMTDVVEMTETVAEETVKIYRCTCELHFLNEDSISRHFGTCRNTKVAKLKCQKCDLLFTPNVLFTHLLAHHSNKSRRYKYDIIEINRNQNNVIQ